jgi:N-methylhydantoinase A/oxoprolinase/acetone carboxylase beta subunit
LEAKKALLITTKFGQEIKSLDFLLLQKGIVIDCKHPEQFNVEIIEVEECINSSGKIIVELKESEINNVLRQVFKLQPQIILIIFNNSNLNAIHEKSLRNVLRTAGYKSVLISSESKSLNSILSCMFVKLNGEL